VVGGGSGGARGSVVSVGVVPWGVGLQEREGKGAVEVMKLGVRI